MPRIRTVKPEFFTSPTIAQLDFPARLLFEAMWCWADDFGIGETNINGLLGFAFPDSDGFTAADLRRFCADIAAQNLATFYTVRGRHFYAMPTWDEHQKNERRSTRRKNPLPDDPDATPDQRIYGCADSAPEMRRKNGANPPLEQGNRGTGEQGNRGTPPLVPAQPHQGERESKSVTRMTELNATSRSGAGHDVARSYSQWAGGGIDTQTQIEVAQIVDGLLADGISAHQIADGIKAWHSSDSWSPTQIRRFVAKAARPKADPTPTKATLRAVDTLATAQALIAEFHQETA